MLFQWQHWFFYVASILTSTQPPPIIYILYVKASCCPPLPNFLVWHCLGWGWPCATEHRLKPCGCRLNRLFCSKSTLNSLYSETKRLNYFFLIELGQQDGISILGKILNSVSSVLMVSIQIVLRLILLSILVLVGVGQ